MTNEEAGKKARESGTLIWARYFSNTYLPYSVGINGKDLIVRGRGKTWEEAFAAATALDATECQELEDGTGRRCVLEIGHSGPHVFAER